MGGTMYHSTGTSPAHGQPVRVLVIPWYANNVRNVAGVDPKRARGSRHWRKASGQQPQSPECQSWTA